MSPTAPEPVLVSSRSAFDAIAAAIGTARSVAIALQVDGSGTVAGPWRGGIRLLALCWPGDRPHLLDLGQTGYDPGPLGAAIEGARVTAHGACDALLWLAVKCGIRPRTVFCTRTAARLLAAGTQDGDSLDELLLRYLGLPAGGDHSASDWGGLFLTDGQIAHAAREVAHLHGLQKVLARDLGKAGLKQVATLEMELLPVVAGMEESGIAVNATRLKALADGARRQMELSARELAGALKLPSLNPSSPQRLQAALSRAGIAVPDTEEATLLAANDGQIVPGILAYRGAEKTFQQAEGLLQSLQPDGRVHARFDPTGTETGRFVCRSPNLQGIGRGPLRSCFVAGPGCRLVVADYSQIELRAVAAIADETSMKAAFAAGDDLHKLTAAAILDKPLSAVNSAYRQIAKSANFGLIYGQGANGLVKYAAKAFGVLLSVQEASRIINKFFAAYPGIARWHAACWKLARSRVPEARTALGRRRLIADSADGWARFTALVNAPVQGGCADGMKQAMLDVARLLPEGARIVSTIHDELIVECPEAAAPETCEVVKAKMVEAMQALYPDVRIDVGIASGLDWGSAK